MSIFFCLVMQDSHIDPATWFRTGAEYRHILKKIVLAARGDIFFDQSPAEGAPDHYYGFCLWT